MRPIAPVSDGLGRIRLSRIAGLIQALLLTAALLTPKFLYAAETQPVVTSRTTASLVSDTDAVQPGAPVHLALRLRITPGWHTYWRNPGDAGIAPEMTVEAPSGGQVGALQWPAPTRVAEGTLTTFGYQGELLLPLVVTPSAVPLAIRAHANWLVCRDLCVPESADFSTTLPAGPPQPSPQAPLFAAAARQIPQPAPFSASITPTGSLTLAGPGLPDTVTAAEFFPSDDGATETEGAVKPTIQHGALSLQTRLSSAPKLGASIAGVVVLTTAAVGPQAFEIGATVVPTPTGGEPLLVLLALAMAGGVLLNLMPCVFPVLAMKAIALARMSGASRRTIRIEAVSYSAGVVVAFSALGLGLAALRQSGQVAGWGFQFQSPLFVTAVAWLLFATGLNLSGVFTIGEGIAGTGQGLAHRGGHWGSFFTGLLAVVVATPCTASFMGVAVAGALAATPPVTALIFAAMGLGLALPYALMATVPRAASLLPRPGAWMAVLRQVLAFPMYAATAWLVWVASQQAGSTGVLTALVGLLGVGFAAWLYGVTQAGARATRRWGAAGVAVTVALAVAVLTNGGGGQESSEPFTAARLTELRGEGRPVFVNMTASWCLSCLVNERIALAPQATRDAFARSHVAYLKGDWTRQDPAILDFLREHGRDGVPLYLYYPPGKPPAVLPQILTEGLLLHEIAGS